MVVRLVGLRRAAARLSLLPLGLLAVYVFVAGADSWSMFDFGTFFRAAEAVVEGRSPYPPAEPAWLETELAYVYPPPVAILAVPFTLLSYATAAGLFSLATIAAFPLGLLALGVRDPRCHLIVFLYPFTLNGIFVGTISPLLFLGLALAWRYRERVGPAAALVGGLVVAKLFVWPLLLWLVATRRFRAAALAAGGGLAVGLGSWAAIGFAGLGDYPRLLALLGDALALESYSPTALALAFGLPGAAATLFALGTAACLGLAAVVAGRRADGDRASLVLALAASLAASPIVWPHYFALLLVPLALKKPSFGVAWVAPLALWAMHAQSAGSAGEIAVVLALVAALVAWTAVKRPVLGWAGLRYAATSAASSPGS